MQIVVLHGPHAKSYSYQGATIVQDFWRCTPFLYNFKGPSRISFEQQWSYNEARQCYDGLPQGQARLQLTCIRFSLKC
jgi:hypothetical protein